MTGEAHESGITISRKELLESGVHFGHPRSQWNPKMKPYVFQRRKGVHILDLDHTMARLEEACFLVRQMVSIARAAESCDMPYLTSRWPGGFFTNWEMVGKRLVVLRAHLKGEDEVAMSRMTKRERSIYMTKIERLKRVFAGASALEKVPDVIFVADVIHDRIAVVEASKVGVPVVGIIDTNSDPDLLTVGIPGNDDAVGSISLLAEKIAMAVKAGQSDRAAADRRDAQSQDEAPAPSSEAPGDKPVAAAAPEPG